MDESSTHHLTQVSRAVATTPPATTSASPSLDQIYAVQPRPFVLTPPTSPTKDRSSDQSRHEQFSELSSPTVLQKQGQLVSPETGHTFSLPQRSVDNCLICPFHVKILSDRYGANEVFGSGAWGTVYKATRLPTNSPLALATPPPPPVSPNPFILAVKVPLRPDSGPILRREGEIFTYLSTLTNAGKRIVHFFGLIPKFSSLVLSAIPLSLEEHTLSCATISQQTLSTRNMSNPVIGTTQTWLNLAHKIISALHWLHDEARVVHGDIKPGNFLLKLATTNATDQFPFQPVFTDFSSSHLLGTQKPTPNTLSAVTLEYTAPELLLSAVLRDPNSNATCTTDVFSTAVTLLVAATGDVKVYSGSQFQRQVMATQGWQVLQLVRSSDQGSRIPRHGVVERTLERAVLKAGTGRVSAGKWLGIVQEMVIGESSKMF